MIIGLFSDAVSILKDLKISSMVRAQLELALSQAQKLEAQAAILEKQNAQLEARLENEKSSHDKTKGDHEKLKEKWLEDVRIFAGMEFRRGLRTGGVWMAFCPKCHIPLIEEANGKIVAYCNSKCGWVGLKLKKSLKEIACEIR